VSSSDRSADIPVGPDDRPVGVLAKQAYSSRYKQFSSVLLWIFHCFLRLVP
jgi:hypothetical protein